MQTAVSVIIASVLLTGLISCSDTADSPAGDVAEAVADGGTARMARRLGGITAAFDPTAHPYANNLRVQHFRDQLEHLLAVGPSDWSSKQAIAAVRLGLANELLLDGQTEAAIEAFGKLFYETKSRRQRHRLQGLLGLAHLRLGEQDNCIVNHTIECPACFRSPVRVCTRCKGARGSLPATSRRCWRAIRTTWRRGGCSTSPT